MAASDPEQRRLIARQAAYTKHATGDPTASTAPARRAFLERFDRQVLDAAAARGESITQVELERRAERLRKAYFTNLSRRALLKRRARVTSGDPP